MARVVIPLLPRSVRLAGLGAVLAVVTYFSLGTGVPRPPEPRPLWDKQLHFAAYAGVALALAYVTAHYREQPYRRGAVVLGGAIAFGAIIELLQGAIPYRYFGWGDLLANCLGAALVALWFPVERRIHYVRTRRLATRLRSE